MTNALIVFFKYIRELKLFIFSIYRLQIRTLVAEALRRRRWCIWIGYKQTADINLHPGVSGLIWEAWIEAGEMAVPSVERGCSEPMGGNHL